MCLFKRKKRRKNEYGMDVITINELKKMAENNPEVFVRRENNDRFDNISTLWDKVSHYDNYKLEIEKYRVGDIFVNRAGQKLILAKVTEYKLIFNSYEDDVYFCEFHKWDYYNSLKMGIGLRKR